MVCLFTWTTGVFVAILGPANVVVLLPFGAAIAGVIRPVAIFGGFCQPKGTAITSIQAAVALALGEVSLMVGCIS